MLNAIEELRNRIHIRTGILVLRDLACLPQAGYLARRGGYFQLLL
jgi:hypothetical protein